MKNPDQLSTAAVLALAQSRIADPKHWCRQTLARTKRGKPIGPCCAGAAQWCAAGAVEAVTCGSKRDTFDVHETLHRAARTKYNRDYVYVNDIHGHAAIMELYDIAIKETTHEKS
jgi:hypothetical protein